MAPLPSRFATRIDAGEGTVLRPFLPSDAPAFHTAASESVEHVHRWLSWCHEDYSLDEAAQWMDHAGASWGNEFNFAIVDADDRLLGGCGINSISLPHRMANLGYWIRASAARRGHTARAAGALARWALEELDLDRIEIVAAIENTASQRTALRAGARREAVLRHRLQVDGRPQDAVMFSIIRPDLGLDEIDH